MSFIKKNKKIYSSDVTNLEGKEEVLESSAGHLLYTTKHLQSEILPTGHIWPVTDKMAVTSVVYS